jgi:hypothetical protein
MIILLLLFLLIASPLYSAELVGFGGAGGTSDCPSGTYKFFWNGDYPSDTVKGCFTNGTVTKEGTQTGGTIGTAYGQTGNGYRVTAVDQRITWAVSGDDGISATVGTVWMSIYLDGVGSVCTFFESAIDAQNYLEFVTNSSRYLMGYYEGQDVMQLVSAGASYAVPLDTWTRVGYSWDDTNNKHSVKVGTNPWVQDSETLTSWTSSANSLSIGEYLSGGTSCTVYIDNVYVLGGYQENDPY